MINVDLPTVIGFQNLVLLLFISYAPRTFLLRCSITNYCDSWNCPEHKNVFERKAVSLVLND